LGEQCRTPERPTAALDQADRNSLGLQSLHSQIKFAPRQNFCNAFNALYYSNGDA
jgi:hypothetical protein